MRPLQSLSNPSKQLSASVAALWRQTESTATLALADSSRNTSEEPYDTSRQALAPAEAEDSHPTRSVSVASEKLSPGYW